MSLFDKFFGKDDTPSFERMGYIDIFSRNDDGIDISGIFDEGEERIVHIISGEDNIDPSKGIASEHWDALSSEAQKALKDQGFYPVIKI